ncbi:RNA helicase required for poly(A+) mRNA export [Naganishia vaughanmartiniae]|uniref:RNA helicase required for poly(A+) mRNA export n=1 Tax=Naganishia vaughanmartiniae TaxID=1424756 RepID=A0ACC2X1E6_9TREE|nr:RNA helicase required for poly(A+) mRNA export [Naganishia vaughanmartiniae]
MSAEDLTNLKISDDSVPTPATTSAGQEKDVAIKDDTPSTEAAAVNGENGEGKMGEEEVCNDALEEPRLLASEFEVNVTLADQQANPDSPLYSAKTFEDLGLHPSLLKGLYAMKFSKPSKIQEKALPLLLANPPMNMIAQSQSGTGKTAAFSLTMLSRISYDLQQPQAICLAPSRELARQTQDVVNRMGQFTPMKTFLAVKESWNRDTRVDAQIIIGTPGTVMDMIAKRVLPIKDIKVLVLDEADEMMDLQGLGDQTLRIRKMLPPNTQTLLFSATFPDKVVSFSQKFAPNANQIRLKQEELSVEGIKQFFMDCADNEAKYDVLLEIYNLLTVGQSIIFCRKRDTADEIASRMTADGHSVASLHGSKDTGDRDAIIDGFREGKTKVLITTNVIARGIDISQVTMVINYDIPTTGFGPQARADTETYLHRVGRTGRFGRQGVAINFISDANSYRWVQELQQDLGVEITAVKTQDYEEMEKVCLDVLSSGVWENPEINLHAVTLFRS